MAEQDQDGGLGGAANQVAEGRGDWFYSAIVAKGSVDNCFAAVAQQLDRRSSFLKALRQAMRAEETLDRDLISIIGERIRALENTLSFRLGILNPEREAAWFRHPVNRSAGPFASTILTEPVFAPFDFDKLAEVKQKLKSSWTNFKVTDLPFRTDGACLWRTLFKLNVDLEQALVLPKPFANLRLDSLPDELPSDVESQSLRAFLMNVRHASQQNRKRLEDCYRSLWAASEGFWDAQQKARTKRSGGVKGPPSQGQKESSGEHTQAGARSQQQKFTGSGPTSCQEGHQDGHARGFRAHEGAQEMRDEFRRRRQSRGMATYSRVTREALECMGFEEMPTVETLRKRYLILARKHHPDCEGGSEEAFKNLSKAYDLLSERVGWSR